MQTLPSPAIARQFGPIVLSLGAPSLRPPRDRRLALALCGAVLVSGCNLADVFETPGTGDVVFVWGVDSVLGQGQIEPLHITVLAGGEPLDGPHLLVTIPDTAFIDFDATRDSIVAKKVGRGKIFVELRSSLTTDAPRDSLEVRVTGAPPQ